jgi:hypothetical protein
LRYTCTRINTIYEDLNESSSARLGGSQQLEILSSPNSKRAPNFSTWILIGAEILMGAEILRGAEILIGAEILMGAEILRGVEILMGAAILPDAEISTSALVLSYIVLRLDFTLCRSFPPKFSA